MVDGAAFSVNVGIGEAYLPAFLLACGGSDLLAGLVAAVPLVVGATLQLLSPIGVRLAGTLRRWVVGCAVVQGLSFVPLALAALGGQVPMLPIFAIASVYWGAGMATGAAWNTWIATLVPRPVRARFFALRTRLTQVAVLAGLLVGGWILERGKADGTPMLAFALIFGVAACARLTSAAFLLRHSDPRRTPPPMRVISPVKLFRAFDTRADARLLTYMLSVTLTTQLAAPYFTPFMLSDLRLSYTEYTMLIGAAFAAKIFSLPMLGNVAKRIGAQRLLWFGGVGLTPLALLWLFEDSLWYLLTIQLFAGVCWAAYELAVMLLIFESVPEEERTSILTYYNFANSALIAGGALVGGWMLHAAGHGRDAYFLVFAVSSVARVLSLLLLARVSPIPLRIRPIIIRTLALRPSMGSVDAPLLPSIAEPPRTPADASSDGGASDGKPVPAVAR